MIGDHIDQKCGTLEVMSPTFEGFENCEEFFVMHIVVEFRSGKSPGVESNGVQLAIRSCDRKDGGKCIVRGIGLDCDLSVRNPMGKDGSCGESLFKWFKGRMALIGKVPWGTLVGKTHEQNGDFRIYVNEMMVEVGETKEGLDILDFLGVLANLE